MQCASTYGREPEDATQVPVCPIMPPHPALPSNPNCGCPSQEPYCPWECRVPNRLETRIFNRPRRCVKNPCNYVIPAMHCTEERDVREPPCNPLCFDWTVEEPGPNDSYGLNGLNWYDWEMEDITRYAKQAPTAGYQPAHPGFSKVQAPSATQVYQCNLPLECYGRFPGPVRPSQFASDVNYFRDWRCPADKAPPAWVPPHAGWATNQHR